MKTNWDTVGKEEFNFLHDYVKDDFSPDYFSVMEFDQHIDELRKQISRRMYEKEKAN